MGSKNLTDHDGTVSRCLFDEYVKNAIETIDTDKGYKNFKKILQSCKCEQCKKDLKIYERK